MILGNIKESAVLKGPPGSLKSRPHHFGNGLPRWVMKGKVKNDFQTFMGSRVSQPVVKLFYNEILNTHRFLFHFLKDVELVTIGDDLSTAIQARLPAEPFPNRSEGVSVPWNVLCPGTAITNIFMSECVSESYRHPGSTQENWAKLNG